MCEYCENRKNLFLTRDSFNIDKTDSSEMIIKNLKSGIVEIASQDSFSMYDKTTRTIRRIVINYCPICGRKLKNAEENMKRLTERIGEGQAIPRMEFLSSPLLRNNGHQRCMDRLAEYEDLEEQGRLMKLPCAVGDIVYRINKGAKAKLIAMIVQDVKIFQVGGVLSVKIGCVEDIYGGERNYLAEDLGRIVFLTREEAKTALEKREVEGND